MIKEKQDLTFLNWSVSRNSSGTAGSFLKAYSDLGGKKIYYKLSNYDSINGITGHENINELIVDRLLTVFGIPHINYRVEYADVLVDGKVLDAYVCASENFRGSNESKVALDVYYKMNCLEGESPLDFCIRMGWGEYIWQMLAVDFIILNRDRHGANIEVLRDRKKRTVRLAPLFDHGLSLLCRCAAEEEIDSFDVMTDRQVQCFVGSRSAKGNLNLIPADSMPALNHLKESDKAVLLEGLDGVISQNLQDKIWDMIWKRWCFYEDFCNSRCNG